MSDQHETIPADVVFKDLMEGFQEALEWVREEKAAQTTEFINGEVVTRTETGAEFLRRRAAEQAVEETEHKPEAPPAQNRQEYAVLYAYTEDGWEATVPDLPDCEAIGDSLEEAQNLIRYFIKKHLQTLCAEGKPLPEPKTRAEQVSVAA